MLVVLRTWGPVVWNHEEDQRSSISLCEAAISSILMAEQFVTPCLLHSVRPVDKV